MLRFVVLLTLFTLLFNTGFYLFIAPSTAYQRYLNGNARASSALLGMFREEVSASGTVLSSPMNSVDIRRGCDAIQVTAFFLFGVLASPVAVSRLNRAAVIFLGSAFLLFANLVRIISIYYAGVYSPRLAEILHIDVWQPAFIFLTIFLWLMWVWHAACAGSAKVHAAK